jgi:Tol biopolymer transport system component
MKANGTGVRRVTWGEVDAREPSFSPNGREIVYTANAAHGRHEFSGNDGEITVVPAAGGRPRSLTRGLAGDSGEPVWSPNGRWIAFTHTREDGQGYWLLDLYLARPDGRDRHRLAINIGSSSYAWSPNSREIAFDDGDGSGRPHLVPVDANHPFKAGAHFVDQWLSDVVWSSDGSTIAFADVTSEGVGSGAILDVSSGKIRPLRGTAHTFVTDISWLSAEPPLVAVGTWGEIQLRRGDGHIVGRFHTNDGTPAGASPDGRKLLFVDGPLRPYRSAIFVEDVRSGRVHQLTQR